MINTVPSGGKRGGGRERDRKRANGVTMTETGTKIVSITARGKGRDE